MCVSFLCKSLEVKLFIEMKSYALAEIVAAARSAECVSTLEVPFL